MTPAEAKLWQRLRDRRLEYRKFVRQKIIGRYRADFFCDEAMLIVEVDGSSHDTPEAQIYDLERTQWLEAQGYRVLRFSNEAVLRHLPAVLESIKSHLPPLPS